MSSSFPSHGKTTQEGAIRLIAYLRGNLAHIRSESIVIDVNGIGYEVGVHGRTFSVLPGTGSTLTIFTYLQVLENDLKLFGFLNMEELDLFKTLLTVSGLGARTALNILSVLKPDEFYHTVISGDEKRLLSVPGIGKKTAQRLVFELKDKVGKGQDIVIAAAEDGSMLEELMEALETLGYRRSEVFPLIMNMKSQGELGTGVEDNIKRVLRHKALQMKK